MLNILYLPFFKLTGMLYLTFDSNIWIYLLDDAWKEYNPLDYLEHWIGEQHIRILLPEIILSEWEKHREEEKENRKKVLRNFFLMAQDIIPSAFIENQNKPDHLKEIIERQFSRIEILIDKSLKIPLSQAVSNQLIGWGIAKKAPLHKKSSIADAIIILSLFEFAKENPNDQFWFISGNIEDFCQRENKQTAIHPHLKPEFDKYGIAFYRHLHEALQQLKERFPVTVDIESLKKQRTKKLIESQVHNPVIVQRFEKMEDSYIDNLGVLNVILDKERPTKPEIILVLGLLNEHIYQQPFYKKVHAPVWFGILKENDVFNPDNNPEPVPVDQGFQIPVWEPMLYLEKLAESMPSGRNLELIPDIIGIIEKASRRPKDNYRTWFQMMKVLAKIPNEQVPLKIFDFIPIWLNGKFRTTLESMELCDHLLPKFLPEQPAPGDIEKAERIFIHLLEIKQNGVAVGDGPSFNRHENYSTKADLRHISEGLTVPAYVIKMAKHFSDDTVFYLGRQIKHLLMDFPNGIMSGFAADGINYSVSMLITDTELHLGIGNKDDAARSGPYTIKDFEQLSPAELEQVVTKIIQGYVPGYLPGDHYEDPAVRLKYIAVNDLYSTTGSSTIHKLGGRHHGDKVIDVFALIFRDLLDEIAKQDPQRTTRLLKEFCYKGRYGMAFFKRIAIYIAARHWPALKGFFWQMLNDQIGPGLFSDHLFKKDLYHLLQTNQANFDGEDNKKIAAIIEQGDQSKDEEQTAGHKAYWQLGWFSALKDTSPYTDIYLRLSEEVKLTSEHFEQLGEIRISSGSVAPFDLKDLLKKSNIELSNYILAFHPSRGTDEATVDGLATALGNAIKEYPEKFNNELLLYKDVYFIYAYHICLGYRDAWKAGKTVDWHKVLEFAKTYITDDRFYSEGFKLAGDGWRADSGWVTGAIGELISEATHNDERAIDPGVLPLVKELLALLVPALKVIDDFAERNMDYPMYALNSSSGKVLRGLIDYALHVARTGEHAQGKVNWEKEIKSLYDGALDREIIDAYILEGMYFQQFAYLDYTWITAQTERNLQGSTDCWLAFMGGFAFTDPPNDLKLFYRLYPHYQRAIGEDLNFNNSYDQGLNKHLVSYFFWGLDTLDTDGLLVNFLAKKDAEAITKLVSFVWQQEDYVNYLDQPAKTELETKVMELWRVILDKYPNPVDEKEEHLISGLTKLIVFSPALDEKNTGLIMRSIRSVKRQSHNHELIENLDAIKEKGRPKKTSAYLSEILTELPFHDYISDMEHQEIIRLISFLYENGQKGKANAICNRLAMQQHEFINDLYKKYNP